MTQGSFKNAANPSLEARMKINDWHFDCRCRMSFSFSDIVHALWREGYPVHVPMLFEEQTKETAQAVPVTEKDNTESDPATVAIKAYVAERTRTAHELDGEFAVTSLPPEDGYPNSFVVRRYEFFNIYGAGGQEDVVMQLPLIQLDQYSTRHQDTEGPYNFPQAHRSAVLFGEPRGAFRDILKPRPDDMIAHFTPEDDLYAKTAESMAGLKQQLKNIMDALVQAGLITKEAPREEPRRKGGLYMTI